MIKLKVLSKVYLVLACLLCFSAYNPALAQVIVIDPGGPPSLAPSQPPTLAPSQPPTLAPSQPPVLAPNEPPTLRPEFSEENPFKNSQYTDIARIAEVYIQLGGQIDDYFYSEGFSTGIDGEIGNEYLCARDDANKVYIGRSDICKDRQYSDYDYIHYDRLDLSNFDTIDGILDLFAVEYEYFQTEDLLGDGSGSWDGCYTLNQGWAGYSGGQCPTINDFADGQINFGYIQRTLVNTAAINQALKEQGIEVTGYTYSWRVKNYDAERGHQGNARPDRADPFQVEIKIYDENQVPVFEKTYDYSYIIRNWTTFTGEETFDNPLLGEQLSELQLSISGQDVGFWAGYYGPEFKAPDVRLNYRMAVGGTVEEDTTAEDLLFTQMCNADPLYDMNCPGYQTAMMDQLTSTTTVDDLTGTGDSLPGIDTNTMGQTATIDGTGIEGDLTGIETGIPSSTGASTGSDNGSTSGLADPTDPAGAQAEVAGTSDPTGTSSDPTGTSSDVASNPSAAEASGTTAEATGAVEEEATETAVAEASPSGSSTRGPGLSANQLAALEAADAVSASAESIASDAATVSAGAGLSATGGVSSSLTSVDPTGSTNELGGVSSSTGTASTDVSANSTVGGLAGLPGASTGSSTDVFGADMLSGTTSDSSSSGQTSMDNTGNSDFNSNFADNSGFDSSGSGMSSDTEFSSIDQTQTAEQQLASIQESALETNELPQFDIIADIIEQVTQAALTRAVEEAEEIVEESMEESFEDQNAREDALVSQALAGSDNEEAQAALLGYNPNFRAYQQSQLQDGNMYNDQGVYQNQRTYDNPRAGLFSGASDELHRKIVRSQYDR